MTSIRQLRAFAAVARNGNLGAAAEEIALSKGAVSQALGELERQLGTPLFDRIHPRLQLNEQGRQLQPLAEAVLDRVAHIDHLFDEGGEVTGSLRIGASQTIGNYLLPRLLAGIPGLDTRVTVANTHDLCEKVAHFELDLALIEGENHHPDLVTTPWCEDEMLLITAPSHPLASVPCISMGMLTGHDWIVREDHSGSRAQFDRDIAPYITASGRVMEINAIEALILAVEAGLGLALVSRQAVEGRLARGELCQLSTNKRFTRTLSLVWHRQKYQGALMTRFITAVRQSPDSPETVG